MTMMMMMMMFSSSVVSYATVVRMGGQGSVAFGDKEYFFCSITLVTD